MDGYEASTIPELAQLLRSHEGKSQERYEHLMAECKTGKREGYDMGMDNISDKVNINVGEGRGGYDGGGQAAMIAALLNGRNQDSGQAGMLAALLNNRATDGGFGGSGGIGLIALLALLSRGHGGVFGGGDGCCESGTVSPAHAALLQTLLEGQSDLKAAVPTAALETTNALQNAIAQLALGVQQGLANTKDSVQAAAALNLTATNGVAKDVATGTLQTQIAINNDGDKTRQLIIDFNTQNLQRELAVAQSALSEERMHRHSDINKVEVTQNVNQQQAQVQFQQQQQELLRQFALLSGQVNVIGNQVARAGQDIVNVGGLMTGTTQTANPVNVK